MKYVQRTFENSDVEMDGHEYFDCTFHNCKLIYRGGTPPSMAGCNVHDSRFDFKGAAAATIVFMNAMYNGGFKAVIDEMFDNIRKPSPGANPIIR